MDTEKHATVKGQKNTATVGKGFYLHFITREVYVKAMCNIKICPWNHRKPMNLALLLEMMSCFLTRKLTGATQTDCVWEGNDVI